MKLHLVAASYTICSSRFRWPVRKLLDKQTILSEYCHQCEDSTHGTIFWVVTPCSDVVAARSSKTSVS